MGLPFKCGWCGIEKESRDQYPPVGWLELHVYGDVVRIMPYVCSLGCLIQMGRYVMEGKVEWDDIPQRFVPPVRE